MLTIALDKEEGEGFDYVRHFFGDMRGIGTMEIEGEQWYVLSHVLTLLFESRMRLVDAKALVEEVFPEYVRKQQLHTPDGIPYGPEVVLIHENTLTFLAQLIPTEAGKRFARWLFGEVIPAIRKDGAYFHDVPLPLGGEEMEPEEAEYIKQATAMLMGLSKKLKRQEKQRLAAEILLDISPVPLQRCLDAEWGTVSSLAQVLQLPHHSQEIIDAQYSVVDILE
ncbi:BRO-N domain-containing protein [Desulfobotulus alkaliphilus]|nr:BRO family protein [Desulfobotulus alkaliphilus]